MRRFSAALNTKINIELAFLQLSQSSEKRSSVLLNWGSVLSAKKRHPSLKTS